MYVYVIVAAPTRQTTSYLESVDLVDGWRIESWTGKKVGAMRFDSQDGAQRYIERLGLRVVKVACLHQTAKAGH